MIEIDISAPEPVFEQIVSQIGGALSKGTLSASDQLPPIRQLAQDLEINPNTVARAYLIMEEAGMIVTKGRAGSIITRNALAAYENWILSMAKQQLHATWNKIRALGPSHESSLRIWKTALKELQNDK